MPFRQKFEDFLPMEFINVRIEVIQKKKNVTLFLMNEFCRSYKNKGKQNFQETSRCDSI